MAQPFTHALTALVTIVLLARAATAALIVNAPQAINKQVTVQLIRTALDNGTSPATAFGDATQRADIEASVDIIWAQAGIDVKFLPTITPYNNTFAYQGINGDGVRNNADFNTIFNNAASAGVLSSTQTTLNLIFVNIVPQFDAPHSESSAAGLAWQPGNGINAFVGDNLLTSHDNRDIIASVIAHEIGHNLGLSHTASQSDNLMASEKGTSQRLTTSQISTAKQSNFALPYTPLPLLGDYNGNGKVDAADYVRWRNGGIGSYAEWRSHFGQTAGSGSFTGNGDSLSPAGISAVPEPNSILYVLAALPIAIANRRRAPR